MTFRIILSAGTYGAASSLSPVNSNSEVAKTAPFTVGARGVSAVPVITLQMLLAAIPPHLRIVNLKTDMQVRNLWDCFVTHNELVSIKYHCGIMLTSLIDLTCDVLDTGPGCRIDSQRSELHFLK
jgi:hypothetical protein